MLNFVWLLLRLGCLHHPGIIHLYFLPLFVIYFHFRIYLFISNIICYCSNLYRFCGNTAASQWPNPRITHRTTRVGFLFICLKMRLFKSRHCMQNSVQSCRLENLMFIHIWIIASARLFLTTFKVGVAGIEKKIMMEFQRCRWIWFSKVFGFGYPKIGVPIGYITVLVWLPRIDHFACIADRKDHRNGIHKPKRQRNVSMKGVDQKFLRNLRFSKKHNKKPESKA